MASFGRETVEAALRRLKKILSVRTDNELADYLEITSSGLSAWKRRGSLDIALLQEKIGDISVDWLLYGVGEPYINRREVSDYFNTIKDMADRTNKGIVGKSHEIGVLKEPDQELVNTKSDSKTIPVFYGVSAGEGVVAFSDIKEYYKYDYLLNERTIGLRVLSDEYSEYGIKVGEMLLIDPARPPQSGNYVIVKRGDDTDLYLYTLEFADGREYVWLEYLSKSNADIKVEYKLDDDIIGVIYSKVKTY